jgi:hypothetical protein
LPQKKQSRWMRWKCLPGKVSFCLNTYKKLKLTILEKL